MRTHWHTHHESDLCTHSSTLTRTAMHAHIIVDFSKDIADLATSMQTKPLRMSRAVMISVDTIHQVSCLFVFLTRMLLITSQDRTLLIAEFGKKLKLPICNVCHMPCCFRTQQDFPLELSFQV